MSDFDLPELPSDEELGITDADREKYGDDLTEDDSELSAEEMAALLGDGATTSEKAADTDGPGGPEVESPAGPAPAPVGPRSRWLGPLTLAALVATAAMASSRTGQVRPARPANAPDTSFSSARAMAVLVDIARRAPSDRVARAHAGARAARRTDSTDLGFETEVQTTTVLAHAHRGLRHGHPRCARRQCGTSSAVGCRERRPTGARAARGGALRQPRARPRRGRRRCGRS